MAFLAYYNGPWAAHLAAGIGPVEAEYKVFGPLPNGVTLREVYFVVGNGSDEGAEYKGIECGVGAYLFDGASRPAETEGAFGDGRSLFAGPVWQSTRLVALVAPAPLAGGQQYRYPVFFRVREGGAYVGVVVFNNDAVHDVWASAGIVVEPGRPFGLVEVKRPKGPLLSQIEREPAPSSRWFVGGS